MNQAQEINDIRVTPADIGQLEDANAIVNFFARLRYDVDESSWVNHGALGLDREDMQQEIRRIRFVGQTSDEEMAIYLFEVRSVTVQLTQRIARSFRNRPENILLVLTKDYERIDFVLVEKDIGESKKLGGGLKQIIRPRSITVDRRKPSRVHLRVLQRFTFTEADGLYQWDKLRSAFTLAEWTEEYFNNRALFSDYYLKERLTDSTITPEWDEDVTRIGREVFRHLADARNKYSGQREDVIRKGLYEPLFRSLGFEFSEEKSGTSDLAEPDYLLYEPDNPDHPIAAVLTYVWNRNLDDEDPQRDKDTPREIPGALVVNVLAKADVDWVVVTNGKLWRLYSTSASNKATNYYEVDLEEAIHAPDQVVALKYWWLFFRPQAFTGFLNDLLQKSSDYAKELGGRLKDKVFTSIFPHFAKGFIADMRANGDGDISEEDLARVYGATMTFLYRLMFILYAESLELLPVYEARGYGEFSLYRLKKMLAEKAGQIEDEAPGRLEKAFSEASRELYEQLQLLFHAVDTGDEKLNLPMYNGGLFSDETEEGRFLAQYAIPDRHLALGLDQLCRAVDDKTQALAFIDFKSLGVRQLGSIYEGLLEFKLRIAPEDLVVIKEKGKEVYLPAKKAGKKRVLARLPKGAVYLENDKRERKATGSYYTPDYIVKYIVEHTVGPVLERKFEELTPKLREAQKRYRQHVKRVQARGNDQPPELFWNEPDMRDLADECLDIKVLDPAMGSGHFLVEAVDFISNRLIEFLNAWSENPVWAMLARTRQAILDDMERQVVSIDPERLTRVALLKRNVLKRCIYGVDLNPMAVELAKVSLWLDAFTLGAPLSFLDHHLKCGNSLIGAFDLSQSVLPGTGRWNSIARAAANMVRISKLVDATPGEVIASSKSYQEARKELEPTIQRLNVDIAALFVDLGQIGQAQQYAYLNEAAKAQQDAEIVEKFERAQRVAEEKRFFHWKLEFPEVFIDDRYMDWDKNGGFDAVVGNPPYGNLSLNSKYVKTYLPATNESSDAYVAFIEASSKLCRPMVGYLGFITPLTWQTGVYYSQIRKKLLENYKFWKIINLPFDVFPDAYIDVGIFVLQRQVADYQHVVQTYVFPKQMRSQPDLFDLYYMTVRQFDWLHGRGLIILDPVKLSLLNKVVNDNSTCTRLGNITESGRGILARPEQLAPAPTEKGNWQPLFIGSMSRYERDDVFIYVLYGPDLLEAPASFAAFKGQRMLVRRIVNRQDRIMATLEKETLVTKKDIYFFKTIPNAQYNAAYLTALINSKLFSFLYLEQDVAATKDDFRQLTLDGLRSLPIRVVKFQTPTNSRDQLARKAQQRYEYSLNDGLAPILEFVDEQLATQPERLDVTHDFLAFLAEQMIDLNKLKNKEVRRFLEWLEERLQIQSKNGKTGIDSLNGKTIIRNYLGDYQKGEKELPWEEFYYRLHKNRRRFGVDLAEVKGEIQAEYEKSLATLLPIKHQLAYTDALIDQIVYKLYGLTDEEIAIIERPAYEKALTDAKATVVANEKLQKDPDAAAEVMAETILPAAQRLVTHIPLHRERQTLDRELPGWHLFHDEVRTFLLTAEYNLNNQPEQLDFSTSIIAYTKAVERMLYHKLFIPFRDQEGATPADAKNKFLKAFLEGKKKLTLGSMNIILPSSKETALHDYIRKLYPDSDQRFFGPDGIVQMLNDPVSLELRNNAAHDQPLSKEDARKIRAWAFAILRKL